MLMIEENRDKFSIRDLQFFLVIVEGSIIFIFVTWKIITHYMKDEKYFYEVCSVISLMNLFNLFLQPLITTESIKEITSKLVSLSIIPNIHYFLIMVFIFFIESNFIFYFISFTSSFALDVVFSIALNWNEDKFKPLAIYGGGLCFILFVYFVNQREKINFILFKTALNKLEKKRRFIENLNSGLIIIDEYSCDYNLKILEYLDNKNSINSIKNSNNNNKPNQMLLHENIQILKDKTNTDTNINYKIKNLILDNYRELNSNLDENVLEIFKRLENISKINLTNEEQELRYNSMIKDLMDIFRRDESFQNDFYVGEKVKKISDSKDQQMFTRNAVNRGNSFLTLKIYLRFNSITNSLEFFVNDVTHIIEAENLKASLKYKKLFLNKFSHEFKNPLINIIQLVSIIKKGIQEKRIFPSYAESDSKILEENKKCHSKNSVTSKGTERNIQSSISVKSSSSSVDHLKPESLENIKHVKNLTMYLISLISDFDFIANSDLKPSYADPIIRSIKSDTVITKGDNIIEFSKFNIRNVVKKCVKIVKSQIQIGSKNVRLSYTIDEHIPEEINSDFRRLQQIILNLLSNAYKFTSIGEITLYVRNNQQQRNLIDFEIRDTGIGFNKEIIQMIEDGNTKLFFGNINTKNNIYGCGLGLDIVQKLVSILGENFRVFLNKNSKGSTVKFSIYNNIHYSHIETNFKNDCFITEKGDYENIEEKFSIRKSNRFLRYSNSNVINTSKFTKKPIKQFNNREFIKSRFFSSNETEEFRFQNKSSYLKFAQDSENLEKNIEIEIIEEREDKVYDNLNHKTINLDRLSNKETVSPIEYENETLIYNRSLKIDEINKLLLSNENTFYSNSNRRLNSDPDKISEIHNVNLDHSIQPNINNKKKMIRILLVDDEKFIRKSEFIQIKKYFENQPELDYEVTECSDGVECLYKIYTGLQAGIVYDYILTDESMNFMRGTLMIKIINTLIEENVMYRIKIFIITSYEPWVILNMHGDICEGIITKPISYEYCSKMFQQSDLTA